MLINVECKKHHIDAINVLEYNEALATVGELVWIILMGIPRFHKVAYFMLSVSGSYLTNRNWTAGRESLV